MVEDSNRKLKSLVDSGVSVEHLKIGECIFTSRPLIISTVLGSCVGATLYHPRTGFAAMFHAMLPSIENARNPNQPCNFVDNALESLFARFELRKISVRSLTVRLFGGGLTMYSDEKRQFGEILDVGRKNVEMARSILSKRGLDVACEDVLGNQGRKVLFYTKTGDTWMKFVSSTHKNSYTFR
ncbi:chemotaxis protein CheD [Desulfovibrio inopinatus]|uniref:chemotaxis protein CheD n=1 Tax=Desulfovibrio inopinatus TaxID=102109 RepID=UPI0003FC4EBF|nr:chemotaxis protein CheD [Desulfovibrio inopinatus]